MNKLSPGPWRWKDEMLVDRDGRGVPFDMVKPAVTLLPEMVRMLRLSDHRCIREKTMLGVFVGPDDECPGEDGGRLRPCFGCQVAALLKDLPEES